MQFSQTAYFTWVLSSPLPTYFPTCRIYLRRLLLCLTTRSAMPSVSPATMAPILLAPSVSSRLSHGHPKCPSVAAEGHEQSNSFKNPGVASWANYNPVERSGHRLRQVIRDVFPFQCMFQSGRLFWMLALLSPTVPLHELNWDCDRETSHTKTLFIYTFAPSKALESVDESVDAQSEARQQLISL